MQKDDSVIMMHNQADHWVHPQHLCVHSGLGAIKSHMLT